MEEILKAIVERAKKDRPFRARLISEPRKVLEEEGVVLKDGVDVLVITEEDRRAKPSRKRTILSFPGR